MNGLSAERRLLAGAAGIVVAPIFGLAASHAADMPVKALPPAPVAAPMWAGWYLGVSAGGAWESNDFNCVNCTDFPASVAGTHNGSAFIGGGQIGYNWQRGSFVYGLEADISGLTKSSGTYVGIANNGTTYGSHVSWMSTVRGRLGVTVGDGATLLYGTGGIAIGRIAAHDEASTVLTWPNNDYSSTRVGWAAGGGIERMLTPHWTVGLEGLFADFGSYTKASSDAGKCCATIRDRVFIGRAKLNYKF